MRRCLECNTAFKIRLPRRGANLHNFGRKRERIKVGEDFEESWGDDDKGSFGPSETRHITSSSGRKKVTVVVSVRLRFNAKTHGRKHANDRRVAPLI